MKHILLVLTIIFIPLCVFSQNKQEKRLRKKMNKKAPPATVWLRNNLFIDETEISNISYLEYTCWLKMQSKLDKNDEHKYKQFDIEYKNALPDTLVWRRRLGYNEPHIEYYFRYPAYNSYPVVGISYQQAVNYCKWRTYIVGVKSLVEKKLIEYEDIIEITKRKTIDSLLEIHNKIYYRLPTKEEWEYAARGYYSDSFFACGNSLFDNSGQAKANFLTIGEENIFFNNLDGYSIKPNNKTINKYIYSQKVTDKENDFTYLLNSSLLIINCRTYKPNSFGLYGMAGNVAEIVSDIKMDNEVKIITEEYTDNQNNTHTFFFYQNIYVKGGSWSQPGYHCRISVDEKYVEVSNSIGFRCVCEVRE